MKPIIYLSVIIILLSACGEKKPATDNTGKAENTNIVTLTDAQLKNASILTGKLEQREISSVLKLNGKIDVPPQNMVSISVPLGGYLKSTKLLPGMHVNKGEAIAMIEDQQYIQLQQDYLTAKARIGYLENEYNRQKDLNQSKASSDKVFQQAEAEYRSQQVLISSLAEKLQLIGINVRTISASKISRSVNIYSPITGFVSKVNVNIGKYVSPTEVLFELVNPTDIHLALKVYEKDLDKLYIGQKLVAYTNNQPAKKHEAEILLIGRDLSADRNADVHCHFETYDKTLVPGTYMNAEVQVKNTKAYAIANEAIVQFEGKQYIYKVIGNRQFEMTEVNIGESENGFTEILLPTKDMTANAVFVTKGAYSLLMMMKNKAE
ncbi:efflux RND transporter periplasmic adaptor subunit [Mucilaginibacter rubeus]|uniref:Efflux RND transporter periplasmic adaptor subunit n=1 Tax=Mucilaginibacter rubeus TaxID=2027860 RepID=A0AAE6MHK1_9SPHI|nr:MULTISPECIES: efflux RND transporter periplasmic adaptor subunit [Mucilaginibacter]QEM03603.1 efflux RND transporter periplasmic adaptor subunit [Mucilaginibacter rubeus]QEM16214.1 efflux RND transporter periplasmic adaptor subunit [Mucilaginibacter gossypii]QTE38844.1 efflux RND transporter periplasmic adaptor subunit [Mucilaginibacter gossypii]QTE41028.1 efflux RND transporter periplasmic adaptor subunit [Mucilaginibacter rubeus]QTE47631.1 efflux RND transporter periplasmic adaptor subuni